MKSLRTLRTQKAWQLIESAEALQNAHKASDVAEKSLDTARRLHASIESEISQRTQQGEIINTAAMNWIGHDLRLQRKRVDTAMHKAAEAAQTQQMCMQEVANIRYGERKLDEHLNRLRFEARIAQDKQEMSRLDDLWLQSQFHAQDDEERK